MTDSMQIAAQKRLAMTKLMADRRAKEARDDEIKGRSPYPASRAQAQQRLAMKRSKADRRAKDARDDGIVNQSITAAALILAGVA